MPIYAVEPDVIRRRYEASMALLPAAFEHTEQVIILDNSEGPSNLRKKLMMRWNSQSKTGRYLGYLKSRLGRTCDVWHRNDCYLERQAVHALYVLQKQCMAGITQVEC